MADASDFVQTETVSWIVAVNAPQTKRCEYFALRHYSNHRHAKLVLKATTWIIRRRRWSALIQALDVSRIAR
jgi:hypothetical protein